MSLLEIKKKSVINQNLGGKKKLFLNSIKYNRESHKINLVDKFLRLNSCLISNKHGYHLPERDEKPYCVWSQC